MKLLKRTLTAFCIMLLVFVTACSMKNGLYGAYDEFTIYERYSDIDELPFVNTEDAAESYFSMDSNTAAYANLRRMIKNGQSVTANAVRTDELLNYFSYSVPDATETFSSKAELSLSPWNEENYLLTIGIKTEKTTIERYSQGNNIVFLIDVSGSMSGQSKLELVKESFMMLLDNLNANDTVSIVTYANGVKTVCSGVKASERSKLKTKINSLKANGGTNGAGGLEKAYKAASDNFINGGNNRVIIATDGDFNVGFSDVDSLTQYISEYAKTGIYLTCLGYGMYNYRDDILETLAKHGNGNYAYIDSLAEAKKVLVDEMDNCLCVVAKDVKAKVKFNAETVQSYRLIGYENKTLSIDDFENEQTDAGELGSNNSVMICYEIKLKQGATAENVADLEIRYKDPKNEESLVYARSFDGIFTSPEMASEDFKFVSAVVEFSLIVRDSKYKANASIDRVIQTLSGLQCCSDDEYKAEFKQLVSIYRGQ